MSPEAKATITLIEALAGGIACEKRLYAVRFDGWTEVGGETTLHFAADQHTGGGNIVEWEFEVPIGTKSVAEVHALVVTNWSELWATITTRSR